MTDWSRGGEHPGEPLDPNQGTFTPAPYPPPSYANPPYPYPQAPPYAYGYGYPPPYGSMPGPGDTRPGLALAAAVLGYINAGLLIIAGGLLLLGASVVTSVEDSFDSGTDYGPELYLDGFANLVAAGLLIAGAVMLTGRNPAGRVVYTVGSAIVLVETVYWLVRANDLSGSGFDVWAVLFGGLAVIGVAFAWTAAVSTWLRRPTPTPR